MTTLNLCNRLFVGRQWPFFKHTLTQSFSEEVKSVRNLSNNTALICKVRRADYLRTYPVLVIQPDGSSFHIRYHEPRSIAQLPLDISTLTPEEQKLRLDRRKPKKKVVIVQEEKDTYQANKYINISKKKSK